VRDTYGHVLTLPRVSVNLKNGEKSGSGAPSCNGRIFVLSTVTAGVRSETPIGLCNLVVRFPSSATTRTKDENVS
jgi:hypothetical protein